MTPLELITKHRKDFEYSLHKSRKSYEEGKLDEATHLTHVKNLTKLIAEYKDAEEGLTIYYQSQSC